MKKSLLALLLVLLLSGTGIFSIGVGAAWNVNLGDSISGGSPSLLLSHDKIPGTILGLRLYSSGDNLSLSVFDDWWLYKQNLTGPLHIALGLGGFFTFNSYSDSVFFDFGLRIPIDLRLFVLDPFEIFLEYAPTVGIGGLGGDSANLKIPSFNFSGLSLGFRFWF